MKNLSYRKVWFVVELCLVLGSACSQSTEQKILTVEQAATQSSSPIFTDIPLETQKPNLQTPSVPPKTTTPTLTSTQNSFLTPNLTLYFSAIPTLEGILYIGDPFHASQYLSIDFFNQKSQEIQLDSDCYFLIVGRRELCFAGQHAFIKDLQSADEVALPCSFPVDKTSLRTSPSNRILFYNSNPENSISIQLVACDLINHIFKPLIELNKSEQWDDQWMLSDSGKYFVGGGVFKGYASPKQYALIDLEHMTKKVIYFDVDPQATDDISLAHNEDIVLLGAQSKKINLEAGYCSDFLMIYTVATDKIHILTRLPLGQCFDMFGIYNTYFYPWTSPEIWSPDNQKVALTKGNGTELCIIRVETGESNCHIFRNLDQWISNWVWSPDSNWIAILTRDHQLVMFSIQEQIFIPFGELDPAWQWQRALIWSRLEK